MTKVRGRSSHGFRKALATLACEDGAPDAVIRALTHTGKARDVFDRYRRYSWETYCDAVRCLALYFGEVGQVIRLAP